MAKNIEEWPKGLLLSGLFIISIITFIGGMGLNYGKDISSDYIDSSRIEDQLTETSNDANSWATAFKSDNLFISTGTIVLVSVWGVIKLVWDAILTFVTIYLDIFTSLFGIPPIVTGIITSIIVITLIFLAWRTIKQG